MNWCRRTLSGVHVVGGVATTWLKYLFVPDGFGLMEGVGDGYRYIDLDDIDGIPDDNNISSHSSSTSSSAENRCI